MVGGASGHHGHSVSAVVAVLLEAVSVTVATLSLRTRAGRVKVLVWRRRSAHQNHVKVYSKCFTYVLIMDKDIHAGLCCVCAH